MRLLVLLIVLVCFDVAGAADSNFLSIEYSAEATDVITLDWTSDVAAPTTSPRPGEGELEDAGATQVGTVTMMTSVLNTQTSQGFTVENSLIATVISNIPVATMATVPTSTYYETTEGDVVITSEDASLWMPNNGTTTSIITETTNATETTINVSLDAVDEADHDLILCLDSADLVYLTPDHPDFEKRIRVWNLDYQSSPSVCVVPFSAPEVSRAIICAVTYNRTVTAKSGGHGYVGIARGEDHGVTLDMRYMDEIVLDRKYQRAWIGPGARMGSVHYRLWLEGKQLVPGGTCPQASLVGLTLGGGQGIVSRAYGLMSDVTEEFHVVTADGDILVANEELNKHLYWALRGGGGGNFGVVTRIKVKTFVPPPLMSLRAFEVMPTYTSGFLVEVYQLSKYAPPEMGAFFAVTSLGIIGYLTCMCSLKELDFYAAEFYESLDTTQVEMNRTLETSEWPELYREVSNNTYPILKVEHMDVNPEFEEQKVHTSIKTLMINDGDIIPESVFDTIQLQLTTVIPGTGIMNVELLGGIINKVPANATAYWHRTSIIIIQPSVISSKSLQAEDHAWLDETWNLINPFTSGGSYVNLLDGNLTSPGYAYYGDNFPTLQRLKSVWDPNSVFNSSFSINNMV